MVLTKTTALASAAVLLVALEKKLRGLLTVIALAGAVLAIYFFPVLRSRYADDYHYFFAINALADVEIGRTGSLLLQLFRNGMWVDRILYPASLVVLLLSVVWLRKLWQNPLFTA